MNERLRYVIRRVGRRGNVRWYWGRKGHPLTRLPDALAERVAMAERLNSLADAIPLAAELPRGTIGWTIARYKTSDDYTDLAPGTVKYYTRYLRDIEALGPALPFTSFSRRAVVDFVEGYPKTHQRRQAAAVLRALFRRARYDGIVETDTASGLRLKTTKARDRVWSDDEIERWLNAAAAEDPHMITVFHVLLHSPPSGRLTSCA